MQYEHKRIEEKWQRAWKENGTNRVLNDTSKPKYYVLDMFPYPSGAGLHVGHPLGYIASDIVARFKRHSGFNVLHPMGYDSFGLPAEQYAIQTGQHPAKTTEVNIARYREQLDRIGFSFDWSREVRTSDPAYYKWTQWIFLQLFDSWYDHAQDKSRPVADLIARFEQLGWSGVDECAITGNEEGEPLAAFSPSEWKSFNENAQRTILMRFRLAYLSEAWVNWCPALGTVLANDEVKDGVSERGGHPVERKRMPQWSMRITAFAQRLLDGLDTLEWSDSIKETQRNWIGRSEGALVKFHLTPALSRGEGDLTPSPSPEERGMPSNDHRFRETANAFIWSKLIAHAKDMRHNPTEAEDRLWQAIRGNATGGRIRRQHIIDKFIVDFVSLPKQLVIEVDGDIHDLRSEEDAVRTLRLNELGFHVIRFRNEEVLADPVAVRRSIVDALNLRADFASDDGPETDEVHSSPLPGRGAGGEVIEVFTTRPDTLFGVTFVTLAPEHDLVSAITTADRRDEVMAYVTTAKNRSERERMTEVKRVSGVFTGAYCIHPFTGAEVPVWVGDYVLGGYGTGAVMAVPGHDERDFAFATHFNLPIKQVIRYDPVEANRRLIEAGNGRGDGFTGDGEGGGFGDGVSPFTTERWQGWYGNKAQGVCMNSEQFDGLPYREASDAIVAELQKLGAGTRRINYRLRDAAFGRQRYWGEPIPIYYKDNVPYALPESELPLKLPEVDKFLPTEDGEPPLARAAKWNYQGDPLETTTMPGWAGSSWYFLRYMDPKNEGRFASPEAINYWQQVDLYVGGSEHATGHLLYFRFWTKFLHDRGWISFDEPAKKLVNQGMIQGVSAFLMPATTIWTLQNPFRTIQAQAPNTFYSRDCIENGEADTWSRENLLSADERRLVEEQGYEPGEGFGISGQPFHAPIHLVNERNELDVEGYYKEYPDNKHFRFVLNGQGRFVCERLVEKMSKSKFNVVNPDDIISKYGADTLRLYEMFLGPIEQSKPWDTNGIEGTSRFLKKFWNLFYESDVFSVTDDAPTKPELKVLHATLKKVTEDIERMSFNTSVSQFMIAVNQLGELNCHKRDVLEPLTVALAPFAPHIAEELWEKLGHTTSVTVAKWPQWDAQYLVEDSFSYPISFNGKTRMQLEFPIALDAKSVEAAVLANPEVQQRLEGKAPKKVIVVPKRIVNIVI